MIRIRLTRGFIGNRKPVGFVSGDGYHPEAQAAAPNLGDFVRQAQSAQRGNTAPTRVAGIAKRSVSEQLASHYRVQTISTDQ